jgi:hypothetical protein
LLRFEREAQFLPTRLCLFDAVKSRVAFSDFFQRAAFVTCRNSVKTKLRVAVQVQPTEAQAWVSLVSESCPRPSGSTPAAELFEWWYEPLRAAFHLGQS